MTWILEISSLEMDILNTKHIDDKTLKVERIFSNFTLERIKRKRKAIWNLYIYKERFFFPLLTCIFFLDMLNWSKEKEFGLGII